MCDNPWRHKKCTNTDIAVIINYKGQELEICHKCWDRIADSDKEWGSDKECGVCREWGEKKKNV